MSLLDTLEAGTPNKPEPKAMTLKASSTGVAVLDMHARAEEPGTISNKLLPGLSLFLDRGRKSRVPIIYTTSLVERDGPHDRIARPLNRLETEPVIYPDSFDKFISGELHQYLQSKGVQSLIVVGAATTFAVLYTVTAAARVYKYNVVIPMDGVLARTRYEQEYSFHQMTILPSGAAGRIHFTELAKITFE
jgi:nicotinamidase-related amidase